MGNLLAITIIGAALLGCSVKTPTRTECEVTCDSWRALSCEEGQPTDEGTPCEQVCVTVEEFEPVSHGCIQASSSCEAARSCK